MENQKSKKGLKIIIVLLSIIILLLLTFFLLIKFNVIDNPFVKKTTTKEVKTDTKITNNKSVSSDKKVNTTKDTTDKKDNTSKEETTSDPKSQDVYKGKSTKANVSESDLVKDTLVTIDTGCTGYNHGAKIIDGNIQIFNGDGYDITIKTGNAKYLKSASFMACDNTYLLFITDKGQVYSIYHPYAIVDESMNTGKTEYTLSEISTVKKLTNTQDSATAFLKDGIVSRSMVDEYGYTSFNVGILEADGSIGTVTYEMVKLP